MTSSRATVAHPTSPWPRRRRLEPYDEPLGVAAPSLAVDPLAPWVNGSTAEHHTLAAGFWLSFTGLSTFMHGVAVFLSLAATLLPIPFLAAVCSRFEPDVKPIERVEMAIIEVAPPPPEPPPPPPAPVDVDDGAVKLAKAKPKLKKVPRQVELVAELQSAQLLAVLGSKSDGGAIADVLTSDSSMKVSALFGRLPDEGGVEGGVLGGLIGNSVGESYGVGGLGLRGTGPGGGGGTSLGLGGLGTKGVGTGSGYGSGSGSLGGAIKSEVKVELEGASPSLRRRIAYMVRRCDVKAELHGSVVVAAGRVSDVNVDNECVAAALRRMGSLFNDVDDGTLPLVITPVALVGASGADAP